MMVNVLAEPGQSKHLQSRISWDDGSTWTPIRLDVDGAKPEGVKCDVRNSDRCSLHLQSVTKLRNVGKVFSSLAPGFVMGIGNAGDHLDFKQASTWLSTDAGRTWRVLSTSTHKYEFGDQGSILVLAPDQRETNELLYSWDFGKSWSKLHLPVKSSIKLLTTIPDNTAQKFLLVGSVDRKRAPQSSKPIVSIFVDFATVGKKVCKASDLERWYVRPPTGESCVMGHKQWYTRRKPAADCVVGKKFEDPVGHEDACVCTEHDFECDFGFVRNDQGSCVLAQGSSLVPSGACRPGSAKSYFMASSGYRKIPGNTCKGGKELDTQRKVLCKDVPAPPPGIGIERTELQSEVKDAMWMPNSPHVLLLLADHTVWDSSDEGKAWSQIKPSHAKGPDASFVSVLANPYRRERAYLTTLGQSVQYTTDGGRSWDWFRAPLEPNRIGVPVLDFHPEHPDWLIWTGAKDCATLENCHAEAYLSCDHGREWTLLDTYVHTCSFLRDTKLPVGERTIVCEVHATKSGRQGVPAPGNMLNIVLGPEWYTPSKRRTIFQDALAFATFDQFFVVAQFVRNTMDLRLMVSLTGDHWAQTQFPVGMKVEHRAFTALDSTTSAIFLHVTTEATAGKEMGNLVKSNWNGTFFGLSAENVNRNTMGYVDFEKMVGLPGIALINTVLNPAELAISGSKSLGTRITHNDGARWSTVQMPATDSGGQRYPCLDADCSLHLHGYTERDEPGALYSSPSAKGQMVGVGNVGKALLPYKESDTFFTRDAGFTWIEVRKGAHRWEFGDHGSIIVLVHDEEATDKIVYTLDEGLHWHEHKFGAPLRVKHILTGPFDRRRRFVLLGTQPYGSAHTTAVHLDFSELQPRQCQLKLGTADSDFEQWTPSELREEKCLFGMQQYYWRRKARAECFVGEAELEDPKHAQTINYCQCTPDDFECEYNHVRNEVGDCVLVPGTLPLRTDLHAQCTASDSDGYWYDRTAYRKVPMSQCRGGNRLDRATSHSCGASLGGHGLFWWASVLVGPVLCGTLLAYWWTTHHAPRGGTIRLPSDGPWGGGPFASIDRRDWTAAQTAASIPYWLAGALGETWFWVHGAAGTAAGKAAAWLEGVPAVGTRIRRARGSYGGYRHVSTDDDAEILRDYEDEDD